MSLGSGDVYSSPAIGLGAIFIGCLDHNVRALNSSSGVEVWRFLTGDELSGSPSVSSEGVVYIDSRDGTFYALDALTGALIWSYADAANNPVYSTPAVGEDGTVYAGFADYTGSQGAVIAFHGLTGAVRWKYCSRYTEGGSPALASGMVFVRAAITDSLTAGIGIVALDAQSGAVQWAANYGSSYDGTDIALGANGAIYMAGLDSYVYAVDGSTGHLLWTFKTGGANFNTPAVGADGKVIIASSDSTAYALDGATGALRWRSTYEPSEGFGAPAIAVERFSLRLLPQWNLRF